MVPIVEGKYPPPLYLRNALSEISFGKELQRLLTVDKVFFMNTNQLTTATPRQIDTKLADLHFERFNARYTLERATFRACYNNLAKNDRFIHAEVPFDGKNTSVYIDLTQVESYEVDFGKVIKIDNVKIWNTGREEREAKHAIFRKYAIKNFVDVAREIAHVDDKVAEALATLAEINAQIDACEDEFDARGGWNRYWLVTSSQGHIHSATNCSSCNKGRNMTTFALVCDLSDAEASEAVDIFGAALCSVCFPDAPVEFTDEVKITQAQATAYFEGGIDAYREMIAKAEARKAKSEQRKAEAAERKARIAEQDAIREAKFLEEIKRQNKEVI